MVLASGGVDLHMHSTVSDGTDTPEMLLDKVRAANIGVFSVTDHDALKASHVIPDLLKEGDPIFIPGVEFSCRDEEGKYHILGFGYDPDGKDISSVVDLGHSIRMRKVRARLERMKSEFGFTFPDSETENLLSLDNPGKPHLANLMVKYGYAEDKRQAFEAFLNRIHLKSEYVRPERAIDGILGSGGVPILAHPFYGSGDELILGEEMEQRLQKLIGYGLRGIEAYYSGFTPKLCAQALDLASRYDLYVTAGSDYHGTNKQIELGDTGLTDMSEYHEGLRRFLNLFL